MSSSTPSDPAKILEEALAALNAARSAYDAADPMNENAASFRRSFLHAKDQFDIQSRRHLPDVLAELKRLRVLVACDDGD